MLSGVADFFKKGGVKTFSSGKDKSSAASVRFRARVAAAAIVMSGIAAPTLSSAFAQQRQSAHVYRPPIENAVCKTFSGEELTFRIYDGYGDSTHVAGIKEIVSAAAATPTGEEVLKPFAKKKGIIAMRYGMGNVGGTYRANGNCIYLNADFLNIVKDGKAYLKGAIVHEAAHAKQNYAGMTLKTEMDAATLFRSGRASEADANTHQIFAAEEMAAAGDSAVWQVVSKEKPLMVRAFLQARRDGKDDAATAKETMLAYYENRDYTAIYDKTYVKIAEGIGGVDKSNAGARAQTSVPADEIASNICVIRGKPYLGADAASLLTDSLRNSVSEEIYARLERASLEHAAALKQSGVRAKTDASYKAFFVRREDGTFRMPEKTAAVAAAVRGKIAGR